MRWSLIFILVIEVSCALVAQAQPGTGERWIPSHPHRVEAQLGLYGNNFQWGIAPTARGRFRLVDTSPRGRSAFIVDLDVAWSAAGSLGPRFRAGNPYVGVRAGSRYPGFRFRFGLGTTVPLTNAYGDRDRYSEFATYDLVQGMHGLWDPWLLEPEIQPLILRGDLEVHDDKFQFGIDHAVAVMFPIRGNGTGYTEAVVQAGIFGAILPIDELAIGARFQFVYFSGSDRGPLPARLKVRSEEDVQIAFIHFLRLQLLAGFIEIALVVNLDEPYGWAFNNLGVFAITVGGGVRF